jgi:hypothetical protein
MIQRIQSLYLILVIAISAGLLCYSFSQNLLIIFDSKFPIHLSFYPTPFLALVILFLYKKRNLQTLICSVLIIFQYLLIMLFGFYFFKKNTSIFVNIVVCFSLLISAILFLARKGIQKDEALVRSVDRIR